VAETFWRYDLKYKQNSIDDGGGYSYKVEILARKTDINNPNYINVSY